MTIASSNLAPLCPNCHRPALDDETFAGGVTCRGCGKGFPLHRLSEFRQLFPRSATLKPRCPQCHQETLDENRFAWRVRCLGCGYEREVYSLSSFVTFFPQMREAAA